LLPLNRVGLHEALAHLLLDVPASKTDADQQEDTQRKA